MANSIFTSANNQLLFSCLCFGRRHKREAQGIRKYYLEMFV